MENLLKQLILCFLVSTLSMASLFSQNFGIEYKVRLGNTIPGEIELAEFKDQEGINIFIMDSYESREMAVKSYDISIVRNGEVSEHTNEGGKFSEESQGLIKLLKKGDVVYLDKIVGIIPEAEFEQKFPSMVFRII